MTKRMLIDATHAEETRVVVLDGNRLEDFDVETAAKKQLKGNIYLAKVVRVEPSLQAAFVEYGGGRHGFLAFGEIHPDYYQIPVADRQRLLEMQEAEARAEEEAEDAAAAADEAAAARQDARPNRRDANAQDANDANAHDAETHDAGTHDAPPTIDHEAGDHDVSADGHDPMLHDEANDAGPDSGVVSAGGAQGAFEAGYDIDVASGPEHDAAGSDAEPELPMEEPVAARAQAAVIDQDFLAAREDLREPEHHQGGHHDGHEPELPMVMPEPHAETESDGLHGHAADGGHEHEEHRAADGPGHLANGIDHGNDHHDEQRDEHRDEHRDEEPREARAPARFMRSYKIQEVIRRRQILLIQVVKEERGSKGAALTTYISLAGRFSVLMPNSPRGGGISRKITSAADRRRLKEVTSALQIPRGMGLIVRTAGANRPKAEITRDCEYLLELWDSIRETTMASMAPALIHEEASLIKRAIRDNYSRDVDEVLVDGEAGWRAARDFMRMLMPAHARKVVLWQDPQPLFARNQVEAQLDAMLVPTVQLKSGGYLVINQTEALVAIDVNSGRSTRERGIEETALKTNLEAADEVARQLRLRDLAGLIVIDFIDMESRRNNAAVEKRMKDALKDDRARIQLGSISSFGLMEMSRQRLRPSLAETSFTPCPHCGGTGHVRSTETSALAVLRAIEDEGAKRRAAEICVHVAGAIALYVLNHKRVRIAEIEARYGMVVSFAADESLLPPDTRIERLRALLPGEGPALTTLPSSTRPVDEEDLIAEEDDVEPGDDDAEASGDEGAAPEMGVAGSSAALDDAGRKRRRRRRGGRREEGERAAPAAFDGIDPALAEQPGLSLDDDAPMGRAHGGGEGASADAQPPGSPTYDTTSELTTAEAAGEEEARSRRRGRRGGRRRRREPGSEGAELGQEAGEANDNPEDQPSSFDEPAPGNQSSYQAPRPVYAGPTPADPFGGGVFDIYDVMEQAEARAAAPMLASVLTPAASAPLEPAPVVPTPISPEPPPLDVPDRPEAEGAMAEATVPADAHPVEPAIDEALPEPAAPVHTEATAAEPAPATITETPAPPPILIGEATGEAAEKKRGWWRR